MRRKRQEVWATITTCSTSIPWGNMTLEDYDYIEATVFATKCEYCGTTGTGRCGSCGAPR